MFRKVKSQYCPELATGRTIKATEKKVVLVRQRRKRQPKVAELPKCLQLDQLANHNAPNDVQNKINKRRNIEKQVKFQGFIALTVESEAVHWERNRRQYAFDNLRTSNRIVFINKNKNKNLR